MSNQPTMEVRVSEKSHIHHGFGILTVPFRSSQYMCTNWDTVIQTALSDLPPNSHNPQKMSQVCVTTAEIFTFKSTCLWTQSATSSDSAHKSQRYSETDLYQELNFAFQLVWYWCVHMPKMKNMGPLVELAWNDPYANNSIIGLSLRHSVEGLAYKTGEITLLCHKVLCLFCTVTFTGNLYRPTHTEKTVWAVIEWLFLTLVALDISGFVDFAGKCPLANFGRVLRDFDP